MKKILFTFIFKSGKVSKVTTYISEEDEEQILEKINSLSGLLYLPQDDKKFVIKLDECSAVEYVVIN